MAAPLRPLVRCVLDQNYPAQTASVSWPQSIEILRLPDVASDLVAEVDDWKIILELHYRGFDTFITNDARILQSPREMVALGLTNSTLVVTAGVGGDPLKANGLLQVHLMDIVADTAQRPMTYSLQPSGKSPLSPAKRVNKIADQRGVVPKDLHLAEFRAIQKLLESRRPHLRYLAERP